MNDDFLTGFHRPPSPEFAHTLLAKLVNEESAKKKLQRIVFLRVALAFSALCLALSVVLLVSPGARAFAQQVFNEIIGKITLEGITVSISKDHTNPNVLPQERESYEFVWTPITPGEIAADYSDLAKLPGWIPSGYDLQDKAALYYESYPTRPIPPKMAVFQWKNHAGEMIQLMVYRSNCSYEQADSSCDSQLFVSVGMEDEPQEIKVNGHSAVIYGGLTFLYNLSDHVKEWNPARERLVQKGLTLIWREAEIEFWVITNSKDISRGDLTRLAESIP